MGITKAFLVFLMTSTIMVSIATAEAAAENSANMPTRTTTIPGSAAVSIAFDSGWQGLEDWGGITTQWMQSNTI